MVINFLEHAGFQTHILFFNTESTYPNYHVIRKPSTIPNIKLYEPPNLTSKF